MNDESGIKAHWERIYRTKKQHEVGWYQPVPETSLFFLEQFRLPKDAKIIDVGGGDSYFVDHLIKLGFRDITILDISETALSKAVKRLGNPGKTVNWMVGDATDFDPPHSYDLWHDRAAFHFLLKEEEIDRYLENARRYIKPGGALVIGTFSTHGPTKCSGLEIRQYSEQALSEKLEGSFEKVKCLSVDHLTPGGTVQNFIFCSFRKRK